MDDSPFFIQHNDLYLLIFCIDASMFNLMLLIGYRVFN